MKMANANFKTLSAAAPKYQTSKATKKAYSQVNTLASEKTGIGQQISDNLKQYNALGNFDPKKSAYYQSAYRSLEGLYKNKGRADMNNTIAAAAANTGGYGNSYGTTAGNQAYQAQLQSLASKVPSLYSAASGEFMNQKNNLASLIGMQQAQQQAAINNAQWQTGMQQALDESRYAAAVNQDNALRELAKLRLQYAK